MRQAIGGIARAMRRPGRGSTRALLDGAAVSASGASFALSGGTLSLRL